MSGMSSGDPVVDLARTFVDDTVRPKIREWDRGAAYPRAAVRDSGLTGLFAPAEDGGLDLTLSDAVAVFEELGRGDAALAFSMSMHNAVTSAVSRSGDEAVRARWGKRLVAGDALGGFSLTEPQAGSDATAITTRATSDDGRWTLSGRKAWVTLGGEADLFLVFAKTNEEPGHANIAMFVVEASSAGVNFGTPYSKAASDFLPITDLELRDAPGHLLVPPGRGMRAALAAIDVARFDIAAIANGLHAEALDVATRYATDRSVFGKPVLEHQGIAWALADTATELEAGRGLTRRAAEAIGSADGSVAVAHAKRFGPDAALRAAIQCSETLGAYGWLHDYPLARFIALAKMLQVVDGSAEIQRVVIARDLVRRASTQTEH
jgi:alkylation response protein AidB-like acyl-CoA dehydrogenase